MVDAQEPLSNTVHRRICYPWSTCQCPHQNLLVLPTLLHVACLIGRNNERSQLQTRQSSFKPWTFLMYCEHSLLPSLRSCTISRSKNILRTIFRYKVRNVLSTKSISRNVSCIISKIVILYKINGSELLNARNQFMLIITICNQVVFFSKHVMLIFYSSIQTSFCFVSTLTWFVGCAWVLLIAFNSIMC